MSYIYVIGSLRHPYVPQVAHALRSAGHEVFDDWHAAGPEADDWWQKYEQNRGRTYIEALKGEAAKNVFGFDKRHLDKADIGVLVLPAGKSGHAELGYMKGLGKKTFVLLEDADPERWDVMYLLFDGVFGSVEELIEEIGYNLSVLTLPTFCPAHGPTLFPMRDGYYCLIDGCNYEYHT